MIRVTRPKSRTVGRQRFVDPDQFIDSRGIPQQTELEFRIRDNNIARQCVFGGALYTVGVAWSEQRYERAILLDLTVLEQRFIGPTDEFVGSVVVMLGA